MTMLQPQMGVRIHPSSVVSESAQIGEGRES